MVGLLGVGRFVVCFALTAITLSGRNDSSVDFAAGLGPVGVHHGQRDVLSPAQGNHSTLPVVAARIDALQRGVLENLYRELEVEPSFSEIPSALANIPAEAHSTSIRLYIQLRQIGLAD